MEERADSQGEDAPAPHAERQLAHLEEGARLQPPVGDAVATTERQGDHDRHREEGVLLGVHRETVELVLLHRGDQREDDERQWQRDAGADEVTADLQQRELTVGDRPTGSPGQVARTGQRGDGEIGVVDRGDSSGRFDLHPHSRIEDFQRPPPGCNRLKHVNGSRLRTRHVGNGRDGPSSRARRKLCKLTWQFTQRSFARRGRHLGFTRLGPRSDVIQRSLNPRRASTAGEIGPGIVSPPCPRGRWSS